MAYVKNSKSAKVRRQLDHPVIDGDGHWLEPMPIFLDYLKQVGGPSLVEHFKSKDVERGWYAMTREERLDQRPFRPTWWGEPGNTLDRATAMVPKLFYERLDDFGVDFCLLYTSLGLFHINNADQQIRRGVSRAVNLMNAEMFAPYKHRIAPAAVVPVYTPEEAIEEATYAVKELGFKVIMISNHVKRPIPALARAVSDPTSVRYSIDSLGYESPYDYDKFWRACVDLKVAVTAHSGSMGWHGRESINNFSFNHIGHFAAASHAFARALVFGGVVKRFPGLRFGLLAGGVSSAAELKRQFVDHFYFGAEADDPMTAWAFRDPHKLHPLFSSDVSHFDVTDMTEVLEEAWELVEHGMITATDFREFTFENAARLHTALNPDFFQGTVVEGAVAKLGVG